jgi:hypothetical protein
MHVAAARAILAFAAGAAILLAASCGDAGATTGSEGVHRGAWHSVDVPRAGPVAVRGGTPEQRALLKQIIARLHPVALGSLTISAVTDKGVKPRPGDVQLTATRRRGLGSRGESRAGWEAWMIGGAFRDRSAALGLPRLLWMSDADGGERLQPPFVRGTRPFSGSLAALRATVQQAAATAGRVIAIRVGNPLGGTADVTLQTSRPIWFLRHGVDTIEAALRNQELDGALIDAYEQDGKHLGTWGYSNRLSSGLAGVWDRTLQTCASFTIGGGPLGVAPPLPCPSWKRPSADQPFRPLRIHGYESAGVHGTGALGFAIQNWNGHPATITGIRVSVQPAGARYTGALVRQPASRADLQAGELSPDHGPQPPLQPFTIQPGDWAFVQLDVAAPPCTAATRGKDLEIQLPFFITYRIDGDSHTLPDGSASLQVQMPKTC